MVIQKLRNPLGLPLDRRSSHPEFATSLPYTTRFGIWRYDFARSVSPVPIRFSKTSSPKKWHGKTTQMISLRATRLRLGLTSIPSYPERWLLGMSMSRQWADPTTTANCRIGSDLQAATKTRSGKSYFEEFETRIRPNSIGSTCLGGLGTTTRRWICLKMMLQIIRTRRHA